MSVYLPILRPCNVSTSKIRCYNSFYKYHLRPRLQFRINHQAFFAIIVVAQILCVRPKNGMERKCVQYGVGNKDKMLRLN